MSMQDPIADLLTRIRNAQMANFRTVSMTASKLKTAVVRVLFEQGFVESYEVTEGKKPQLHIALKYFDGKPVIGRLQRVSKPGLRRYVDTDNIPKVLGGLGIAILSTSKGVMSDMQAKQLNQGGELLCVVE